MDNQQALAVVLSRLVGQVRLLETIQLSCTTAEALRQRASTEGAQDSAAISDLAPLPASGMITSA